MREDPLRVDRPERPAGTGGGAGPFDLLGIPPTLDLEAVKRAYFARLARCPPHVDPEGFGELRRVYEPLSTLPGLARAYAEAPLDLALAFAERRAGAAARIESGRSRLERSAREMELRSAFIRAMAGLRLGGRPPHAPPSRACFTAAAGEPPDRPGE